MRERRSICGMAFTTASGSAPATNQLLDLAGAQCAAGGGDLLALRFLGQGDERRSLTYRELSEAVDRCAAVLVRLGLTPGETVAVMTGRTAQTVVAALGIWKAGGVYCPIFADLGPDPVLARLELGDARILIAGGEVYRQSVMPSRPLLPNLRHVLLTNDPVGDLDGLGRPDDCLDLAAAMACASLPPGGFSMPDLPASHAVMMHFTSGTTAPISGGQSRPKAVMHDIAAFRAMADSARAAFALQPGEMLWCTGEPGWITHTAFGLVAPLVIGAAILMDPSPVTATRCLAVLEDEPVSVWYTTPTVIRTLIGGGAAMARSFRPLNLRLAASCGEPLSTDTVEWGRDVLGVAFRDTWWQTETGGIVLAHTPDSPPVPGSMGRPLPGVALALVRRTEDGVEELPPSAVEGELAIRADSLPPWRSLGGEGGALPEEMEGWHLTGDFVRRDAAGYYWFLGRGDEVIKSAGRMVGPFEVEAVLMSHPAVAEIGVIGLPDPLLHERIVAFIALNPGFSSGPRLKRELMAYARDHLGDGLCPHEVRFQPDLPRTPSGKIIRRALKVSAQTEHELPLGVA